ncbi:efflux transporter outer membrane subunit [Variovorax ginsengisoli]|uniref:Multidrug efflux system outer membrane protein n=1 Tax=Variovorax ginsengisoli TaxID=363844 RepID=A0ABT9SF35_9BURK|nr:efflux transporter outer membrane subunit [Variovorax ginsengisoli]MDP9902969.1 multidrug efflux system outer membrane protein [Variovorax ginsengisoli]
MTRRPTPLRRGALGLGLALPVVLLTGCINLAPPYVQPTAPVPQAWTSAPAPAAPGAPSTAPAARDLGWREFFVDERLRGVVALALENNRDARVAALNIERARAQYGIARAAAFPSVSLGASGSRSRTPGSISASGTARLATQYNVNLGLTSYELDLFGRVRNLGDAALESYFATEDAQRGTQISLVAEVATAWLVLATDQQRLQLARDTLASRQKSYDLIQRSHALGAQSGLALAQAQTTVDTARADAAAFDSQVEQSRNALTLLVGNAVPPALLPPPITEIAKAPAAQLLPPPDELPSSILQQRPDVLAAEHTLRASNANIGAARAAFFPRISLTGSAGTASSSLSGLFKDGSAAWSFAPSISLPIFEGGLNRANLGVAETQQQIQLATYEKTLQVAFREVADALAARRTLGERLAAQQSLVAATTRAFELSDALFKNGGAAYLDVLDAQRSLYTVQQSLISLQLVEQTNRLTLYKVLGGGWRDATDQASGSGAAPVATGG